MAPSLLRRLVESMALACASCALGHAAVGHPHVRISVEVVLVVEHGAVAAVKHRWTFDEDFRRSNLLEFDVNQNNVLEESELAAFRQLALETLKRFDSFTVVWRGPTKVPLKVSFDMQARRPTYAFSVTLSRSVPATEAGVLVEVYDPTYFSAFDFPSTQPVSIESKDGTVCSVALVAPASQSAQMRDYRAFVSAFGPPAAKLVTPRSIKVTCQSSASQPVQTE